MSTAVRVFRVAVAWLALCGAAHADFPVWTKQLIAVPPSATGITYYVATNGADTNNGTSPSTPFRTIHKAVSLVAAGDTVLIKGGLYREGIDLSVTGVTGTALAPITFGSYGDGEVIVDGSKQVTGWTRVSGTPAIWQATLTFTPVGIVVNEVPLRQVPQSPSTAPKPGVAGVVDGSGKWFWNATTKIVTADFSTTLGPGGDPNGADIVVPNNNGSQQHVFWFDSHYITFKGLTIRGSGSNGAWGYGSHVTVDNCDIKFNGKAAVAFLSSAGPPAIPNWDNAVLTSHAYHNVLVNWPRGNNGFAEAGGGWPGTIVWDTNLRPLARGNVVHMNGGEGIISYGTVAGLSSGSALFEQNIAYDNWSVNLYFDNQPNDIARNNFLFRHPPDPNDFLYVSNTGTYSTLDKFSVCLMLADEQNSSDSTNNFANLDGSQVVNNILAGCRIGIRDYSEGTSAIAHHGLKNTVIMNNTIIMPFNTYTTETYGIYLQDNGANDASSVIGNNIVYGFNNDALFASEKNGAIAGITIDYNDYFSASLTPFQAGLTTVVRLAFAQWKLSITGVDVHSLFADPLFLDVTGFRAAGTTPYDWRLARPAAASPAKAACPAPC
ncbi:MAG TPA: DUF1565 domain-containing protein, partial [Usitatibacter sp.]|nr:DUF1565 domain-containing protein [Usitatibacter sp.]